MNDITNVNVILIDKNYKITILFFWLKLI